MSEARSIEVLYSSKNITIILQMTQILFIYSNWRKRPAMVDTSTLEPPGWSRSDDEDDDDDDEGVMTSLS